MLDFSDEAVLFEKQKDFLVCMDSDGCVFDTMEIKHKECFIPNTINIWELQSISRFVRETAEFVNLYSRWRGTNRFPALVKTFELLEEREEIKSRAFKLPDITSLKMWISKESRLGNPALEEETFKTGDPVLKKALEWSKAGNADVSKIVRGIPPFPYVMESLKKMSRYADPVVVSSTPVEALEREWHEHGADEYVRFICGQETGTKAQCIQMANNNRYGNESVLKIGDAMGDLDAAKTNGVLFYPIISGREEESWQRFYEEAFDMFIQGRYKGEYEEKLIQKFKENLPEIPPWKIN